MGSTVCSVDVFETDIGNLEQVGGELTDFIIVLRNTSAVRTFSGNGHLSVGGGLSAAAANFGRAAEAGIRAGDGGCAACYTYSCSKGAFLVIPRNNLLLLQNLS